MSKALGGWSLASADKLQNRGVSVRAASLTLSQEGRILSLVSGGFDENSLSWGPDEAIVSSTGPPAIRGFELSGSQIDQNLAEWLVSPVLDRTYSSSKHLEF